MSDPNAVMDGETSGRIATWVWDRKEEIADSLARLYSWFRSRKRESSGNEAEPDNSNTDINEGSILIIGSGGVGKTTLAKFLSGEYDLIYNPPGEYIESIETDSFTLSEKDDEDKPSARIVVPPGQEHRRPTEWGGLYTDISAGRFRGVVLMNCYGYHSLGKIRYKEHHLFAQARGKNKFLAAFVADRRNEEMKVLSLILPHLVANQKKMWLLTLVAKQDLWWRQAGLVEAHYRNGTWAQEIERIKAQHGNKNFRHEYCFVSLVINNYATGLGEILQENTAGYDHKLYVSSLRRLIEIMDSLRKWEANDGQAQVIG